MAARADKPQSRPNDGRHGKREQKGGGLYAGWIAHPVQKKGDGNGGQGARRCSKGAEVQKKQCRYGTHSPQQGHQIQHNDGDDDDGKNDDGTDYKPLFS